MSPLVPVPDDGEVHTESFISIRSGQTIRALCRCRIGRPHTHQDWLELYQPTREDT